MTKRPHVKAVQIALLSCSYCCCPGGVIHQRKFTKTSSIKVFGEKFPIYKNLAMPTYKDVKVFSNITLPNDILVPAELERFHDLASKLMPLTLVRSPAPQQHYRAAQWPAH
mmetsp:Transcript_20780/g.68666  ORF Transcript_20780/g.68666 Transcript_20780/m.68666 type:complete len:111 (-) Transcript_20780:341-673(-)